VVIPVYKPTITATDSETENLQSSSVLPGTSNPPSGGSGNELEDIFADTIPIPMHFPGSAYGDGDKPWFYMDD
jgi:hypothetical protein